ncbi:MAG TPA: hypothetical protein DHW02_04870, partial [Ktedonobacter sp.]|nr:hypothetical protein [Ktedonobacter sp.]
TTQVGHEPVPILIFNPGPGPRTERIQVDVQLPGSLYHALVVDGQENQLPYRIVNRWRQEIGTMPFAREMLAASIALAGITTPEQFIEMTKGLIVNGTGRSEESFVISHVHVEDHTESPIHHVPHTPQPGVVYIEIMIAPTGRVVINEQELVNTVQHILSLLNNEDIHMFEISLVDQARETIELLAPDLPANGYKTLWLYPRGLHDGKSDGQQPQQPQPQHQPYPLIARENSIENQFYTIEANAQDGTLTVTDKANGTTFPGLNRFVDSGDVGDLYNYSPPEHDTCISQPVEPPKIELLNAGPVQATLRISGRWSLPTSCTSNRAERSSRTTICPISSEVTLNAHSRRIHIHTSVENRARDHRLRVLFPVSYQVEQVAVEETFGVQMRPIAHARPANVAEWIEEPVNVLPQKRFVDIGDGQTALAILNRGLPECEILQGNGTNGVESGTLAVAVTLLRCVEWLSRGDLSTRRGHAGPPEQTPEAQCQGHSEFDYALVPHNGTWETNDSVVLREAQVFNIPAITRVIGTESQGKTVQQLPAQSSFVEVEPAGVVISSIKRSNDGSGLLVRVYNPSSEAVNVRIRLHDAFNQAYKTNLLEERQDEIASPDTKSIAVSLQTGEIATFLFVRA